MIKEYNILDKVRIHESTLIEGRRKWKEREAEEGREVEEEETEQSNVKHV